jgi:hypothetical protein
MDPQAKLMLEVEEAVNMFPTFHASNSGRLLKEIFPTVYASVVYALWIAYTQRQFDDTHHTQSSIFHLFHSILGGHIRGEFAVACTKADLTSFKAKWGIGAGLAEVLANKLILHLITPTPLR